MSCDDLLVVVLGKVEGVLGHITHRSLSTLSYVTYFHCHSHVVLEYDI